MKNFISPGRSINVTAPAAAVSGQLIIIGALVGVCATDVAAGASVSIDVEGIFDLPKVVGDAFVAGAVAKVTPATGIVGVAGTAAIGVVTQAAASGSSTVRVRLTPSIAGTPTVLETATHHEPVKHAEHELTGAKRH